MDARGSNGASRGALWSWALYDWGNSAFATLILTFIFAAYFSRRVASDEISGSAAWGTTIGLVGIAVAIAGPILGAIADQGGRRKPWLFAFTLACVIATALLWFVTPRTSSIPLALGLVAVAVGGFEFAAIFYNSMLPQLAPPERIGRWSGWGWGLGYAGGVISLILALVLFVRDDALIRMPRESAHDVRAVFLMVSAWYLLFSLPIFLLTPGGRGAGKRPIAAARSGLVQLRDSIRHVRRYAPIVRFLIARMIYTDGLATLFVFGGLYVSSAFGMDESQVIWFGIAMNVSSGVGAVAFAWIDDWIGPKMTILISLVGLVIPIFIILIVHSTILVWIFGAALGVFVGPVQAASRSWLAHAAPEALRTQMFGLYTFSGKATAFIGPFMVGQIGLLTGSQRIGMGSILVLFIVGFLIMLSVPAVGDGEANRSRPTSP